MSLLPALPSRAGLAAVGTQVHIGAVRTPDKSAVELVSGPRRTYAELDERTNRLAHALLAQNLGRGDRVAVWLGNCLESLDTYLACAKAGLVVVQINIRHKPAEARYQLEDSGARVLVFGDPVAAYVEELDLGDDLVLVTAGKEH